MDPQRLTIIIACEHSADSLNKTLEGIHNLQPVICDEIFIVDNGGCPGREEVADKAQHNGLPVRYVNSPGISRADAWNYAALEAKGKILAFLDDDCTPPPGWLAAMQNAFDDPDVGIVGGPDRIPPDAGVFDRCLEYVLTSLVGTLGMRTGRRFAGEYYPRPWNMAVIKEAFLRTGGFDRTCPQAPELPMIRQLQQTGYRTAYRSDALVFHLRETDLQHFLSRDFYLGMERGRGISQPGLSRVYSAVSILVILLAAISFGSHKSISGLLTVLIGLYAVLLWFSGIHAAIRLRSPVYAALVPLLIPLHHASHLFGYMAGRVMKSLRLA